MRILAAVCTLACLAPHAVRADAAPDAAEVQAELRAALGPIGGDAAPENERVSVTKLGDRLSIVVPHRTIWRADPVDPNADMDVFATVRREAGRWRIEDIAFANLTMTKLREPGREEAVETARVGEQHVEGVFDPSLSEPSSIAFTASDASDETTGPDTRQVIHVGSYEIQASMTPDGAGRVDLEQNARSANISISETSPSASPSRMTIEGVDLSARLPGVSGSELGPLAATLTRAIWNGPGRRASAPDDPATMLWSRLASGGAAHLSVTKLTFAAVGSSWGADGISVGLVASAAGGQLGATADFVLDGLSTPEAPRAAPYLPRHLAMRASAEGADMAALTAMIRAALARDADRRSAAVLARGLIASGTLKVDVQSIQFDVGEARFAGVGRAHLLSTNSRDLDGAGRLTAEDFDQLLLQVQASEEPDVAKIAPALIYAKGLARTEGGKLIWDIVFAGGKLTVNGVDPIPQAMKDRPLMLAPSERR